MDIEWVECEVCEASGIERDKWVWDEFLDWDICETCKGTGEVLKNVM